MLISKRRWRWLAIATLTMCLTLLFQPTRVWIQRGCVAVLLGTQAQIDELVFHSQRSIVEVRGLAWAGSAERADGQFCRFGLSSPKAWFAVDQRDLVNGQLRCPKAILQETDLFLETADAWPSGEHQKWKDRLVKQIEQIDWEQTTKSLNSLVATQELKQLWCGRIERWRSRSQEMLAEARQLEHEADDKHNPLRFEESIREQIQRIRDMATEQTLLTAQLDRASSTIDSESLRLAKLQQQDLQELDDQATNLLPEASRRDELCKLLAQDLGWAVWQQLAPYGEIVDRLSRASLTPQRNTNVDVRAPDRRRELFRLDQLKASGTFRSGPTVASYQAAGHWALGQDTEYQQATSFEWQTAFQSHLRRVEISANFDSCQSTTTALLLVVTEMEAAKPSQTLRNLRNANDLPATQFDLACQESRLNGTLSVSAESLGKVESRSVQQIARFAIEHGGQPLRMQVTGSWADPHLQWQGTPPSWIERFVDAEFEGHLTAATDQARSKFEAEFNSQLLQLRQLMAAAVREAKSQTAADNRELLATHDRLQKHLAEMSGSEFARRPSAIDR